MKCHKGYKMKKLFKLVLIFVSVVFLNANELNHAQSYESAIAQG